MRTFSALLVSALFSAACASFDRIPLQDEAEELVWNVTFGMDGEAPHVEWVTELSCADGKGFVTRLSTGETCVGGVFWDTVWLARVARPKEFRFSESAFAHEFWHAALYKKRGDSDSAHRDGGFAPGGIVDGANALLRENGL